MSRALSLPGYLASTSPATQPCISSTKIPVPAGLPDASPTAELDEPLPHRHADPQHTGRELRGLHGARHRAAVHVRDPLAPQLRAELAGLRPAGVRERATVVHQQLALVLRFTVAGEENPGRTLQITHAEHALGSVADMRPTPLPTASGQESVWDYPRPPRVDPSTELVEVHLGGEVIARSTASLRVLETSHPPTLLPARRRVRPGRAAADERSDLVRVEGPGVVRRPGHGRRHGAPRRLVVPRADRGLRGPGRPHRRDAVAWSTRASWTASGSCPRRAASTAAGSPAGSSAPSRASPAPGAGDPRGHSIGRSSSAYDSDTRRSTPSSSTAYCPIRHSGGL